MSQTTWQRYQIKVLHNGAAGPVQVNDALEPNRIIIMERPAVYASGAGTLKTLTSALRATRSQVTDHRQRGHGLRVRIPAHARGGVDEARTIRDSSVIGQQVIRIAEIGVHIKINSIGRKWLIVKHSAIATIIAVSKAANRLHTLDDIFAPGNAKRDVRN